MSKRSERIINVARALQSLQDVQADDPLGEILQAPIDLLSEMAVDEKARESVEPLAAAFLEIMGEQTTEDEREEIDGRNRQEPNPNVCHSHDFLDANMVMEEAFQRVMGRGCGTTVARSTSTSSAGGRSTRWDTPIR